VRDRVTRLLALDTSTQLCSVALAEDGRMLATRSESLGRGHAERLIPMIEAVLAEARLDYAALDAIVATVGPGTFTGVRVGLAAARGLALAAARPLIGVATLEALAAATDAAAGRTVVAVMASGRDRAYVQTFGPGPRALDEPTAPRLDDLVPPPGALLVGDAAARVAARTGHAIDPSVVWPDIAVIARLGLARLAARGDRAGTPADVTPLYVRPPDARPMTPRAP
jgi:tRNA threonylcarbamoyladenosine biosynthesis protein TsaB